MHRAFLIGISRYRDHTLKGVPNDFTLLVRALEHRKYPRSAIEVFLDTHTTREQLHTLLAQIGAHYAGVDEGSCYVHFGASGALSLDPLEAGVLPTDGDECDFSSAVPFSRLNQYFPVQPGIRVTTTLDI